MHFTEQDFTYTHTINGKTFQFFNRSAWTKHGFKHVGYLNISDPTHGLIGEETNTVYYLNRTWESYPFKTVNCGIVSRLISQETKRLKNDFMTSHNYKRMTVKRRREFEDHLKVIETPDLDMYTKLYEQITD